MAREQLKDSQLQDILARSCPNSLVLQPLPVGQPPVTLYCDVSMDCIRPFVPEMFRWEIFNNQHALPYPGANIYAHPSQAQILLLLWEDSGNQCSVSHFRNHGQHTIFVRKDWATCSHVFLRTDFLKKGLQPPYESPYKVLDRTKNVSRILRHAKTVSVSIDRLKPAYFPKELAVVPEEVKLKKKLSLQPKEVSYSGQEKPRESSSRQETTTRSGRRVRFNPKYI
ncbi:transposon Ty3-I Gag-Pol polyprotein [Trichonephila clavata]|uniref:Transposon Ty3-I Gag-Pol polyprotein n=1 Tax=Trichonephila clavata TaxID=2740835 RepID=A0A8X6K7Q8_TRICU|nr:transposon Ty3-I Gag-Pol polyprotein [Trichonephila clavata]